MNLTVEEREVLATAARTAERMKQRGHTAWKVVTGPPGSGKTTVIRRLKKVGCKVVEDSARALMLEDLASGVALESLRHDYRGLQRRILARALSAMSLLDLHESVYFDYGIAESLAFLKGAALQWESIFVDAAARVVFSSVFVLEPLRREASHRDDPIRLESEALRQQLHTLILEVYRSLGADPIPIPVASVEQRVEWILNDSRGRSGLGSA
jgi:predicted ATPase